jgi:multimeric flavodoxin WrbA
MTIMVLGGSPKGEQSVTMQYVEYLRRRYPDVVFDIRQAAQPVRKLESDDTAFTELMDAVEGADAVLWAFPLYYMSASSGYHRFIELVEKRDSASSFTGKPAASLTTSIHFYDNTARDWIRSVCEDWGMAYVDDHAAAMDDLMTPDGRRALEGFFANLTAAVLDGAPVTRQFPPPAGKPAPYTSVMPVPVPLTAGHRVVVATDTVEGNLGAMVNRFRAGLAGISDLIDLREIKTAGGCMGCLRCGPSNKCRYGDTDDVIAVYTERVVPADLYVMAMSINGRWHSWIWKQFIERGFYRTHQQIHKGKQIAIILSGSLAASPALREVLTAYVECMGANLVGIVTDESGRPDQIDSALDNLVQRSVRALEIDYRRPQSFLGYGGLKVFRDDIYGHLGLVFRADHRAYRRSGLFRTMLHKKPLVHFATRLGGLVLAIPFVRSWVVKNMRSFMLMPYRGPLALAEKAAAGGLRGTAGDGSTAGAGAAKPDDARQTA